MGVGVIVDDALPICIAVGVMPEVVSGPDDCVGVNVKTGATGVWDGGPQIEPSLRRTSSESVSFG